jgi:S1-C subfamily serine protease
VKLWDITPEIASGLGIDRSLEGVLVENVSQNSPADQAGLRSNEIVLRLDKSQLSSLSDFQNAFNEHKKHDPSSSTLREAM